MIIKFNDISNSVRVRWMEGCICWDFRNVKDDFFGNLILRMKLITVCNLTNGIDI